MENSGPNRNRYWSILFVTSVFLFFFLSIPAAFAAGIKVVPEQKPLLIQMINFLFLIWALNVILYRPIRNIITQRKNKISDLEQSVETSEHDAISKNDAYKDGISAARKNGMNAKKEQMDSASEEEKKIIEAINKKSQENLAQIREKIAKDAEGVREALQQEIDSFADAIGQKILGRAL